MRIAILVMSLLAVASAAGAQVQRMFVSSSGVDANPCSRTAPCRNFAAAVAAVADGGEVVVLDSAGYGPVSITKGVSIIAPSGVYAGISAFTGDAVTIDATGKTVVLRGLTLNGLGGFYGIDVVNAQEVHVEDCVVTRFSSTNGAGIYVNSALEVFLEGVTARDNYFAAYLPSFGVAAIEHSAFDANSSGIVLANGVCCAFAIVADTHASVNSFAGLYQVSNVITEARNSVFSSNTYGVRADGGTMAVSGSMVTQNYTAGFWNNGAATFRSTGNHLDSNSTATAGTISPLTLQ